MRTCRRCLTLLPLDQFRQRPNKRSFICRPCEKARDRVRSIDTCPECGGEKRMAAKVCQKCDFATRKGHHRLGPTIAGRAKTCPRCGGQMNARSKCCWDCASIDRRERMRHMKRLEPEPIVDRFITKFALTGTYHDCFEWQFNTQNGYGQFSIGRKPIGAHRASYELFAGTIPKGLTIDHLCRNKKCVNPLHLEVCTLAENSRRQATFRTHCNQGHEYTPENTRASKHGRVCRQCERTWRQHAEARRRERLAAPATAPWPPGFGEAA